MAETQHQLTAVQRFFTLLFFPFAKSIETHSRSWIVYGACGHKESIWERGGIRWLAKGSPKFYGQCPVCKKNCWHQVYHEDSRPKES